MKTTIKVLFGCVLSIVLLVFSTILFAPAILSNSKTINLIETQVEKTFAVDMSVEKLEINTNLIPNIAFYIEDLTIIKNDQTYLQIKNFDFVASLAEILNNKLIIKKLTADYIFVDINKILSLFPNQKQENKKNANNFQVDIFNALLGIKDCLILYNDGTADVALNAKNLKIEKEQNPKFVRFDIALNLKSNGESFVINLKDNDSVYIDDKKLYVKDCILSLNNSKIKLNFVGDENQKFELKINSDFIDFSDIASLIRTNLLVPNGYELLEMFTNINGGLDLYLKLTDENILGEINLKKIAFNISMINNLPVLLNAGKIHISDSEILLKDFKGYYGKSVINKIDFNGTIKDYLNTFDTAIVAYVVGTKEFTTDYLSQMIGYPLELVGDTIAQIKVNMLNGIIDTSFIFRLKKGYDILVDGVSLTPVDYERAFRADIGLDGNMLKLKKLNYYIAEAFEVGVEAEPLVTIFGNFDMAKNMEIHNLGFEIVKPLPSEFLNVLLGQKIFRRGMISGFLEFINNVKIPYIKADLALDKVLIPAQRLSIYSGKLLADKDKDLQLNIKGKYKRAEYEFFSNIANEVRMPIVVKNIGLKLDNIDVDRILHSFANQPTEKTDKTLAQSLAQTEENEAKADEEITFNTDFIVIEKGTLELVKGVYKEIDFDNVLAEMSLNKNGVLQLYSNRFNIEQGTSSVKVYCDLKKQLYKISLGIKDVDSDAIATSLLNLPREISGKARGLIRLETDKSLKLNGMIKFDIKDGVIAKVGLIEYALKFASLFRNPLAMISPATVLDLTNIPDGDFEKIEGTLNLKNNIIERMVIKSYSPQLSSYIVGRYDLEQADTSMRIYTKFSNKGKGFAGFLRNISLNKLANNVPLSSRNDSLYYSSELSQIPEIDAAEKDTQVFLTKIEGDVEHFNFISSLKKIK